MPKQKKPREQWMWPFNRVLMYVLIGLIAVFAAIRWVRMLLAGDTPAPELFGGFGAIVLSPLIFAGVLILPGWLFGRVFRLRTFGNVLVTLMYLGVPLAMGSLFVYGVMQRAQELAQEQSATQAAIEHGDVDSLEAVLEDRADSARASLQGFASSSDEQMRVIARVVQREQSAIDRGMSRLRAGLDELERLGGLDPDAETTRQDLEARAAHLDEIVSASREVLDVLDGYVERCVQGLRDSGLPQQVVRDFAQGMREGNQIDAVTRFREYDEKIYPLAKKRLLLLAEHFDDWVYRGGIITFLQHAPGSFTDSFHAMTDELNELVYAQQRVQLEIVAGGQDDDAMLLAEERRNQDALARSIIDAFDEGVTRRFGQRERDFASREPDLFPSDLRVRSRDQATRAAEAWAAQLQTELGLRRTWEGYRDSLGQRLRHAGVSEARVQTLVEDEYQLWGGDQRFEVIDPEIEFAKNARAYFAVLDELWGRWSYADNGDVVFVNDVNPSDVEAFRASESAMWTAIEDESDDLIDSFDDEARDIVRAIETPLDDAIAASTDFSASNDEVLYPEAYRVEDRAHAGRVRDAWRELVSLDEAVLAEFIASDDRIEAELIDAGREPEEASSIAADVFEYWGGESARVSFVREVEAGWILHDFYAFKHEHWGRFEYDDEGTVIFTSDPSGMLSDKYDGIIARWDEYIARGEALNAPPDPVEELEEDTRLKIRTIEAEYDAALAASRDFAYEHTGALYADDDVPPSRAWAAAAVEAWRGMLPLDRAVLEVFGTCRSRIKTALLESGRNEEVSSRIAEQIYEYWGVEIVLEAFSHDVEWCESLIEWYAFHRDHWDDLVFDEEGGVSVRESAALDLREEFRRLRTRLDKGRERIASVRARYENSQ
ncbi:MAG: hypothetical protein AAGD00_00125 [Planctomycetota bacterium]